MFCITSAFSSCRTPYRKCIAVAFARRTLSASSHCPSYHPALYCIIPNMRFHTSLLVLSAQLALAFPQSSQDSTSVSAEYANDDKFQQAILDVTNLFRRQHNASSLAWNESLAEYAKDWSKDCKFEHSGGPSGENLASGYPNVTASIEAWGNERDDYDFDKGDFSYVTTAHCTRPSWTLAARSDAILIATYRSATGHFTQLVWRNTTTVGCARTQCNGDQDSGKGNAPGWYVSSHLSPSPTQLTPPRFVVCEYFPTGNVLGQFTANVLKQLPADEVPSASDAPTATGSPSATATPKGAASGVRGSVGALWVALGLACVFAGSV